MNMRDVTSSKALKGFIKGSLFIIGLFIVFSFGIISFVLCYNNYFIDKVFTLILIFAFFIFIFFFIIYFGFYFLVNNNYKKLYKDLCIKNEEYKQKIHDIEKLIKYVLR